MSHLHAPTAQRHNGRLIVIILFLLGLLLLVFAERAWANALVEVLTWPQPEILFMR